MAEGANTLRRLIALAVLVAGGGALLSLGQAGNSSASAAESSEAVIAAARARAAASDPRLAGAYRFEQGGWIYVHLEGEPAKIGFAHAYLLQPETEDASAPGKLRMMHSTQAVWNFF